MEAIMRLLTGALLLLGSMNAALAATDPPVTSAGGVAEMLQRRQESQLREQLAREGRWEEVKRMDEEQLRRQLIQKRQNITRLNAELAREGKVDPTVSGDGVVSFCGPERPASRAKADASATNTSYVR
jgi:hypothetical protein